MLQNRKPANILQAETFKLQAGLYITWQVQKVINSLRQQGWRFYIVNQSRGRCYYKAKIITLPIWALQKPNGYFNWYTAHECAHTFAQNDNHGPIFMHYLKKICPEEYWHFETNYKPGNAKSAGISKTPGNKIVSVAGKKYDIDVNDLF